MRFSDQISFGRPYVSILVLLDMALMLHLAPKRNHVAMLGDSGKNVSWVHFGCRSACRNAFSGLLASAMVLDMIDF